MTLRTIVDETVVSYEVATTDTITVSTHFYTSKLTHFFSTSNFFYFFSPQLHAHTSGIGHSLRVIKRWSCSFWAIFLSRAPIWQVSWLYVIMFIHINAVSERLSLDTALNYFLILYRNLIEISWFICWIKICSILYHCLLETWCII
jgi:hypothetical protein